MSSEYVDFRRPDAIDPFKPFPPMDSVREKARALLIVEWPEQPASIYQLAWELRNELALTLNRSDMDLYVQATDLYKGGELPFQEYVEALHAIFHAQLRALAREISHRNLFNIW